MATTCPIGFDVAGLRAQVAAGVVEDSLARMYWSDAQRIADACEARWWVSIAFP